MAEVLDIIQRIQIDADTDALEALNAEFGTQFKQIQEAQKRITAYEGQLARTAENETRRREVLNNLIARQRQNIDRVSEAIGRQVGLNNQLSNTAVNAAGRLQNLTFAGSQLLREAPAFTFSIQTGILALSNNIPILLDQLRQAQTQGASTSSIFRALGQSIFSLNGFITLGVAALTIFGDKLFKVGEAAEEADKEYQNFLKGLNQNTVAANRAIDDQITSLNVLQRIIQSGGPASANAIKQLQNQFPDLAKNINIAALAQGDFNKLFDEIRGQIRAKEQSNKLTKDAAALGEAERFQIARRNGIQEQLNASLAKEEQLRVKIAAAQSRKQQGDRTGITEVSVLNQQINSSNKLRQSLSEVNGILSNIAIQREQLQQQAASQANLASDILFPDEKETGDPYKKALDRVEAQGESAKLLDASLAALLQSEIELNKIYTQYYQNDVAQGLDLDQEQRQVREERYSQEQRRINILQELRTNDLELSLLRQKADVARAFNEAKDLNKFLNQIKDLEVKNSRLQLDLARNNEVIAKIGGGRSLAEIFGDFKPEQRATPGYDPIKALNDEEKLRKRNEESIKKSIDTVEQYTIQSLNAIYEARLYYLDREIEARRRNVEEATKLAEYGNTEILRQETERLRRTEEEREKVAQNQLRLNSILAASSAAVAAAQAIQTVTNAGATGDPYSAAARIAAAVAALAAGFAFVTNLVNAFRGFKDGVIDFQGKGTGTSDSNLVRISHGESVLTARATQQYKPYLEAMNKGTFSPFMMAAPKTTDRTDELIEAYGQNRTEVHARISGGDFVVLTQKYSRRMSRGFR